jgi:hypothetical protein
MAFSSLNSDLLTAGLPWCQLSAAGLIESVHLTPTENLRVRPKALGHQATTPKETRHE